MLLHTVVLIYYRVKYIPRLNGITITYVLRNKRRTILLAWCSRGTNFASQGVSWNCPSNYPAMRLQEVIYGEELYPILGDYLLLINYHWIIHDFIPSILLSSFCRMSFNSIDATHCGPTVCPLEEIQSSITFWTFNAHCLIVSSCYSCMKGRISDRYDRWWHVCTFFPLYQVSGRLHGWWEI